MFADTKKILVKAQKQRYAVGHFNFQNLETLQGIVQAAQKLKAPVILATSEGAVKYAGMEFLYGLAQTAAEQAKVPLVLHLDHGRDGEMIKKAIKLGYSSVMLDASHQNFETNVRLTKRVVQLAHHHAVSVEAELGTIGRQEDSQKAKKIIYTAPEKAQEFVERTGCDFLAVAIGTSHGAYKFPGEANLRQDILQAVRKRVKVPLVLHGASSIPRPLVKFAKEYGAKLPGTRGVPDSQIRQAVRNGICKVNIDSDLRIAFDAGVRKVIKTQPADFDPRHILGPARDLIQKVVEQKIRLLGSAGKA